MDSHLNSPSQAGVDESSPSNCQSASSSNRCCHHCYVWGMESPHPSTNWMKCLFCWTVGWARLFWKWKCIDPVENDIWVIVLRSSWSCHNLLFPTFFHKFCRKRMTLFVRQTLFDFEMPCNKGSFSQAATLATKQVFGPWETQVTKHRCIFQ